MATGRSRQKCFSVKKNIFSKDPHSRVCYLLSGGNILITDWKKSNCHDFWRMFFALFCEKKIHGIIPAFCWSSGRAVNICRHLCSRIFRDAPEKTFSARCKMFFLRLFHLGKRIYRYMNAHPDVPTPPCVCRTVAPKKHFFLPHHHFPPFFCSQNLHHRGIFVEQMSGAKCVL